MKESEDTVRTSLNKGEKALNVDERARMEEQCSSEGFWYSELSTIDKTKGREGIQKNRKGITQREGWSGANETQCAFSTSQSQTQLSGHLLLDDKSHSQYQ